MICIVLVAGRVGTLAVLAQPQRAEFQAAAGDFRFARRQTDAACLRALCPRTGRALVAFDVHCN